MCDDCDCLHGGRIRKYMKAAVPSHVSSSCSPTTSTGVSLSFRQQNAIYTRCWHCCLRSICPPKPTPGARICTCESSILRSSTSSNLCASTASSATTATTGLCAPTTTKNIFISSIIHVRASTAYIRTSSTVNARHPTSHVRSILGNFRVQPCTQLSRFFLLHLYNGKFDTGRPFAFCQRGHSPFLDTISQFGHSSVSHLI